MGAQEKTNKLVILVIVNSLNLVVLVIVSNKQQNIREPVVLVIIVTTQQIGRLPLLELVEYLNREPWLSSLRA